MVRLTASYFALATLIATTPALADDTVLMADAASSKSRAAARHDTSEDTVARSTNARSKARRATRGEAATDSTVVATQNRGKRSRRNPSANASEAPVVAATDGGTAGLLALAANRDALGQHVQATDFKGTTGALALYHLIGKAVAEQPMNDTEAQALTVALDGVDVARLVAETEARLMEAAAEGETLDQIAEALGIPRPTVAPGAKPNLGAALILRSDVTKG